MCHLLLFMPAIALPIFWIVPLNIAVPVYAVIALTSAALYWLIANSMRKTPQIGVESLVGAPAEVVCRLDPGHGAEYLVRSQGELWSARSGDQLEPGETVRVGALRGIHLLVERSGLISCPDGASDGAAGQAAAGDEAHCHRPWKLHRWWWPNRT